MAFLEDSLHLSFIAEQLYYKTFAFFDTTRFLLLRKRRRMRLARGSDSYRGFPSIAITTGDSFLIECHTEMRHCRIFWRTSLHILPPLV